MPTLPEGECFGDAEWDSLRTKLDKLAFEVEEWAGIPIPMQEGELVAAPRSALARFERNLELRTETAASLEAEGYALRNQWWSHRLRAEVYIVQNTTTGKVEHFYKYYPHAFPEAMATMGVSYAWGLEQEYKAQKYLATLVPPHIFKMYQLTGMFLETSKRSGVTYVFRRCRPTVVIDARDKSDGKRARILCALCLHPVAYYSGTWAGALCPTDDVIAHLMLMRGDEHLYWRRANQHHPGHPLAGL